MAEEHEKETSVEEVEAWVDQTSQAPLFLAGSLSTPVGFFGVFFECPCLLVGSWETVIDQIPRTPLRTKLGPQSLAPLVLLLLPSLLEEWAGAMILLLKEWLQEVIG